MAFSVNATAAAALLLATSVMSLGVHAQSIAMPSDADLQKLMGEQSATRAATLGGKMGGEIHALQLRTVTPAEAAA